MVGENSALVRLGLSCALCVLGMALRPVEGGEGKAGIDPAVALLHERVWTIDTHVDTPMRLVGSGFDIGVRHDVRERGGRVDLPRMKEGGLDAVFFAVYLDQRERTAEGNERAKQEACRIFDAIHKAVGQHPDQAMLATVPDDAERLETEGKRAIYIGIENGYAIGQDVALLQTYYDLGARYVTLCHGRNNDICDSSTDKNGPEHHGLSDFGRQVVREMNRLGMMVDLSHASDETFCDVLEVSRAPVMASHSCTRALCSHARNLDDDMLRALAQKGGVIQICILDAYVKNPQPNPDRDKALQELRAAYGDPDKIPPAKRREAYQKWEEINRKYPLATVADVVDHIDHVVKVVGIDYVGIGTDFDGGGGVADCCDVSEMGNITQELVRRGYNEDQIRKIWGGNFLRAFREVERLAGPSSLNDKIDWPRQQVVPAR